MNTNLASAIAPQSPPIRHLVIPFERNKGVVDRSIFAELEFNMGTAYTQAVMWCLQVGPDVTRGVDDEDFDSALDIQENTLAIFRQLLEVV